MRITILLEFSIESNEFLKQHIILWVQKPPESMVYKFNLSTYSVLQTFSETKIFGNKLMKNFKFWSFHTKSKNLQ